MNEEQANELAGMIQKQVPLVERPFRDLGNRLGLKEQDILGRLRLWKEEGLLREISAVMEGSVLGYQSALVCGRIPAAKLDETAALISRHPTVTHNYEREHEYNLWFTIAAPPDSTLEDHLRALEDETGGGPFHALRRTLTFKVGVVFDLLSKKNNTEKVELAAADARLAVGDRTRRIIRALQTDLPLVPRPFAALAAASETTQGELLDFATENPRGAMRKYVATFRHRRLGVRGNCMVVWHVPEGELAAAGDRLANASEVSHCYARETFPGFPYNLYSMVHVKDEASLEGVIHRLRDLAGTGEYLPLKSLREFKKTRLRYFLPELEDWERAHALRAA